MARPENIDLEVRARLRAWVLHFRALYYQERTDKELAEDMGLGKSTISGIVKGTGAIGLDVLLALRRTFKIQADVLLTVDPTTSVTATPDRERATPRRQ